MYDPCRRWRRKLTLLSEGTLAPSDGDRLQAHLARCPACRLALQADIALRAGLRARDAEVQGVGGHAFDERVLRELAQAGRQTAPPLRTARAVFSLTFFQGVAAGACIALCATIVTLSLGEGPADMSVSGSRVAASADRLVRHTRAVPLGSLLEAPAPRAALLWTPPPSSGGPAPAQQRPARPAARSKPAAGDRGVRPRTAHVG